MYATQKKKERTIQIEVGMVLPITSSYPKALNVATRVRDPNNLVEESLLGGGGEELGFGQQGKAHVLHLAVPEHLMGVSKQLARRCVKWSQ